MLERSRMMLQSFLWLAAIAFGVWVATAGKRYREEYRQSVEGFRLGGTRLVELTLVASDQQALACAADVAVDALRCGHRADGSAAGPTAPDDATVLQPYYTVGGELLLGAGLWRSPALQGPLPTSRFTAACNFHCQGVTRAATIRFAPGAAFAGTGKLVPVGTLSDCVLP